MNASHVEQGGRATGAPTARRWLGTLVRTLVTLGAFGYLATLVDPREVLAALGDVPAGAFAQLVAWFLLAMAMGAYRWGLLLAAFGAPRRPAFMRLLRLYYVGLFYNTFLPGGVGGDLVRGIATREAFGAAAIDGGPGEGEGAAATGDAHTSHRLSGAARAGSATAGLSVVLVERVLGLAGLLLLTAGATLLRPIEGVPAPQILGGVGVLAVAAAIFGLLFAQRLAPHLPGPLQKLASAVPVPVHYLPIAVVLGLALLGHLVLAVGGHALVVALAPQVTLNQSLVLIPIALASAFVPITVSGAGVREAAFVALYGLIGVDEGAALAASLGMWGCQLAMAACGGLVALTTPIARA